MGEGRAYRDGRWTRLKVFGGVLALAFMVTLGLVVGNRLSEEALGVLAGAVCGVCAAIPTSLIVVAVSRRHREGRSLGYSRAEQRDLDSEWHRPYPPVVVVSPGSVREGSRAAWNTLPPSLSTPMDRSFRVVGGASGDRDGGVA